MHRPSIFLAAAMALCSVLVAPTSPSHAQPVDARLGELKTLNGHFPFEVPGTKEAWDERAKLLRQNILVSAGLWPEPERTPLNAVIHGRIERDGFSIEKVYFESLPGHFVTGLLFRPFDGKADSDGKAASVKRPGILCPHGHGGRMQRFDDKSLKAELDSGREKYAESGQTPKLARCVQLARMGCVTFMFDMLGYADSVQIPYQVAHRHQDPRPEEARPADGSLPDRWIMYSIDAELRLQSIMGLQVWNASRALDFLAELPDVDTEKLGVTGNSGGGTQTIILGAIDPRVKVSFPNGMVSTSMQGGCYCENCNLLRVDTGNVELAGLMAPRPQAMTAVDDWTRDMMTDGYPQLQQLYRMVGNPADVMCTHFPDFPHSFNYVTRGLMYTWMNRYLNIGASEPIVEADFAKITDEEGSVWDDQHPQPTSVSPDHERDVCAWFDQQAQQAIDQWWPQSSDDVESFRDSMGQAWKLVLSLRPSPRRPLSFTDAKPVEHATASVVAGYLQDPANGAVIPLTIARPKKDAGAGSVVVWCRDLHSDPQPLLDQLLQRGHTVLMPSLFGQTSASDPHRQRLVDDNRHYAAFTFGYNKTLFAERVADVLDVIQYAANLDAPSAGSTSAGSKSVSLVGSGDVAAVALAAAAVADGTVGDDTVGADVIKRAAVVLGDFRFANVDAYSSADFVPGAMKYGDIDALVALNASRPLWLSLNGKLDDRVQHCFTIAGAANGLVLSKSENELPVDEIAEFLSK